MKKATKWQPRKFRPTKHQCLVGLSLLIIILLAVVASHAATSSASFEPENGSASSAITQLVDNTASNGKAVKFGPGSSAGALSIAVSGKNFVNGQGATVQLHGVNRSGAEYMCTGGGGPFDGPSDAASVNAMLTWHINAVRIPVNEQCWLGINGLPNAGYNATQYQQAIIAFADLLISKNIYPIIDLQWTADGTNKATGLTPMPDRDHAPAFWTSAANAFKNRPAVLLDMFNEPWPDNNQGTTAAWTCWKNGGTCANIAYTAAGMQELVTAVRNTGATNVIVLSGIQYSGNTTQINTYKPTDPLNQLAGSQHNYDTYSFCVTTSCWQSSLDGVGNIPFIAGELGDNSCSPTYPASYMTWADTKGVSYLGWAWNTYDCSSFPSLISNFDGTPTAFGAAFKQHFTQTFP